MISIPVTKRATLGKKFCKSLRGEGKIPAILYGLKRDVVALVLDAKEFLPVLQKHEHLVSFQLDGREETVVIKEVQYNTFGDKILHVDFVRIDMSKKLNVSVRIRFVGIPKGAQQGGIWEKTLRQLEISCLPINIPEFINVHVENLDIGSVLRVKDIQLPANSTLVTDPEIVACSVQAPKAEATTTEGTADKVEPEVIKKAKPKEEEEEK